MHLVPTFRRPRPAGMQNAGLGVPSLPYAVQPLPPCDRYRAGTAPAPPAHAIGPCHTYRHSSPPASIACQATSRPLRPPGKEVGNPKTRRNANVAACDAVATCRATDASRRRGHEPLATGRLFYRTVTARNDSAGYQVSTPPCRYYSMDTRWTTRTRRGPSDVPRTATQAPPDEKVPRRGRTQHIH